MPKSQTLMGIEVLSQLLSDVLEFGWNWTHNLCQHLIELWFCVRPSSAVLQSFSASYVWHHFNGRRVDRKNWMSVPRDVCREIDSRMARIRYFLADFAFLTSLQHYSIKRRHFFTVSRNSRADRTGISLANRKAFKGSPFEANVCLIRYQFVCMRPDSDRSNDWVLQKYNIDFWREFSLLSEESAVSERLKTSTQQNIGAQNVYQILG